MAYSAVIFDMDGTVLNTIDDIAGAVNAMRTHEGLETLTVDYVRSSVGNGVQVLMEKTLPGGSAYPRFDKATAYYRAYYESHNRIRTQPYPGIVPLLEELNRRGIRLAVVSNKQDIAVQDLSRQMFPGCFALSMGEKPPLRRKPFPDMVDRAVEELGVSKEECLYVGDSEVDAATAEHAGMDCALVSWGFRSRELLETLPHRYLIEKPEQLLKLV